MPREINGEYESLHRKNDTSAHGRGVAEPITCASNIRSALKQPATRQGGKTNGSKKVHKYTVAVRTWPKRAPQITEVAD
ncbi:MAG: hypothetical protein AMXMBFR44_6910 [Candidatus Campbellbacteria bacterium]